MGINLMGIKPVNWRITSYNIKHIKHVDLMGKPVIRLVDVLH